MEIEGSTQGRIEDRKPTVSPPDASRLSQGNVLFRGGGQLIRASGVQLLGTGVQGNGQAWKRIMIDNRKEINELDHIFALGRCRLPAI